MPFLFLGRFVVWPFFWTATDMPFFPCRFFRMETNMPFLFGRFFSYAVFFGRFFLPLREETRTPTICFGQHECVLKESRRFTKVTITREPFVLEVWNLKHGHNSWNMTEIWKIDIKSKIFFFWKYEIRIENEKKMTFKRIYFQFRPRPDSEMATFSIWNFTMFGVP